VAATARKSPPKKKKEGFIIRQNASETMFSSKKEEGRLAHLRLQKIKITPAPYMGKKEETIYF